MTLGAAEAVNLAVSVVVLLGVLALMAWVLIRTRGRTRTWGVVGLGAFALLGAMSLTRQARGDESFDGLSVALLQNVLGTVIAIAGALILGRAVATAAREEGGR
ncbi:hypothetical protein N802_18395 [Knoellia sinensis KCTC 19936]|uniref:Uncharacterized protein n=1 Tax=Knoellia sinensis KCTC 19936 TaxID=1385520 RepID=A0A0A0J4R1_9MICO|nr:hypothetical protein [Knoellia sinensis]KGN32335.1 hypothetical protein N802_18395 [Knoellia sinensis KCTC 19936]